MCNFYEAYGQIRFDFRMYQCLRKLVSTTTLLKNQCFCFLFQMEQLSDEELDHGAEEDSDKEDQDLDKMFGAWLGELDKLTQVRKVSVRNIHLDTNYFSFDNDPIEHFR